MSLAEFCFGAQEVYVKGKDLKQKQHFGDYKPQKRSTLYYLRILYFVALPLPSFWILPAFSSLLRKRWLNQIRPVQTWILTRLVSRNKSHLTYRISFILRKTRFDTLRFNQRVLNLSDSSTETAQEESFKCLKSCCPPLKWLSRAVCLNWHISMTTSPSGISPSFCHLQGWGGKQVLVALQ